MSITPNIWEFSLQNILSLTAAYSIYEPITYAVIPKLSQSSTVQEYYNHKKVPFPVVVSGDYLYSLLLFLIAQQVISAVFGNPSTLTITAWIQRFFTFCVVQWIGDFSWYKLITNIESSSTYIDFFKRYTKQVGASAIIGDSLYGLIWFSLTQFIASFCPMWLQIAFIVTFVFGTLVVSF